MEELPLLSKIVLYVLLALIGVVALLVQGATVNLLWEIGLIILTLILYWLAQVINALPPTLAGRLGLSQSEPDVDSTFLVDS